MHLVDMKSLSHFTGILSHRSEY